MSAAAAATTAVELVDRLGLTPSDVTDLAAELRRAIEAAVDEIVQTRADRMPVYPEVEMTDVLAGTVSAATVGSIRRRGCVVIRGTFDADEARDWNDELGAYLARNSFRERPEAADPESATGSRIWGVYWSRPQVQARQHERMVAARRFLNDIWRCESHGRRWFDPEHDIGYPDRVRRREPGARSRGLGMHGDAPSVGGWRLAENQLVFAPLLTGGMHAYDPWDAAHRTTREVESPVGCTVFRAFQGWTALSEMQPGDGVLHVAPIPAAVGYRLVVGLAGELDLGDGHRPAPRRDHGDDLISRSLVPIPAVAPGDTVWWHGDLYHSVADAANDTRWGNVMYIGSSPRCPRNDAYLSDCYDRFVRGVSPRDFPSGGFETDFEGRATPSDLGDVGRAQFGRSESDVHHAPS